MRKVPAVIAAADALIGYTTKLQRCTPMAAMLVQQSNQACSVTKCHQVLAQYFERDGQVFQLGRRTNRLPVKPHGLAHGTVGLGVGEQWIFSGPGSFGVPHKPLGIGQGLDHVELFKQAVGQCTIKYPGRPL